MIMYKLERLQH